MNEQDIVAIVKRIMQEREGQAEYTPKEVAELLGREASTVREWARLGRVRCNKHGKYTRIPHDEVQRLKQTGCALLPPNLDKLPPSLRARLG